MKYKKTIKKDFIKKNVAINQKNMVAHHQMPKNPKILYFHIKGHLVHLHMDIINQWKHLFNE